MTKDEERRGVLCLFSLVSRGVACPPGVEWQQRRAGRRLGYLYSLACALCSWRRAIITCIAATVCAVRNVTSACARARAIGANNDIANGLSVRPSG